MRDRLRAASREAFERCVTVALEERADALLIAGDLFDGRHVSFETERFLLEQLARLGQAGVAVVYATGNHDPGQVVQAGRLAWPDNVTVVADAEPRTIPVKGRDGETAGWVTAAGHATAQVTDDLSLGMRPRPDTLLPQAAMLHTQVSNIDARGHHPYAPSNATRLRQAGFHYWALGHVHRRQAVSDDPPIHYPGNLQGSRAGETGPKGGLLVDLSDPAQPDVQFRPFAPVRWEQVAVPGLEDARTLDQLRSRVAERWAEARAEDAGEPVSDWMAVVELIGPAALWRELRDPDEVRYLAEDLTSELGLLDAEVRTEEVRPLVRVSEHEDRKDVLGAVLQLAKEVAAGECERLGLGEEDLAAYDPGKDGSLSDYLARLMQGGEEEILSRMLVEQDGRP